MRYLPLPLSAHRSAWGVDTVGVERLCRGDAADAPCRFCGAFAAGRQEVFHLDGDHANHAPTNLAAACSLCHLAQHLDVAARQRSVVLAWLPEVSQAAVFMLTRSAHLALLDADADPTLEVHPARGTEATVAAWRALKALLGREEQARERLRTSDPGVLGAALLALTSGAYRGRANLLGSIRLVPTGRMLVGGEDIYPGLLRAWAGRAGPKASAPLPASTPAAPRRAA